MKDPKQEALDAILGGIDNADAKDTWGDSDPGDGKPIGGVEITIGVSPKSADDLDHSKHNPETPVEGCPLCKGGLAGEEEATGEGVTAPSGEVPKWAKKYAK
jgi:hypothetical protein